MLTRGEIFLQWNTFQKNTGRIGLRKPNPIRKKGVSGHVNSAVSCLVVTTRHSFHS